MRRARSAVWSIESARLIAGLARMVRDVGVAEELAQDALVAALEQWPAAGVPDNPGAWLMATAKHHAINHCGAGRCWRASTSSSVARWRRSTRRSVGRHCERIIDGSTTTWATTCSSLIFVAAIRCCRAEARVALTLRLLGGLTTEEIARAFLTASRRSRSGSCAPSARWPRRVCPSRCRAARARAAPLVGARGHLPDLQRGLRGQRRRRPHAPRPVRGGAATGADPRRASRPTSRRCTAWSR